MDVESLLVVIDDCIILQNVDPDHPPLGVAVVDLDLDQIPLSIERTRGNRNSLIKLLDQWPCYIDGCSVRSLNECPNFLEVARVVRHTRATVQLFAIGDWLGFWKVITPTRLGAPKYKAYERASIGQLVIDGYRPSAY